MSKYMILYICNIKSYKDINLSNDIIIHINSDDNIISDEIKLYEPDTYKIINYETTSTSDYDCELVLIPKDIDINTELDKITNIINSVALEIIIVSENLEFQNIIKELVSDVNITCYSDFKFVLDITNYLLDKKHLKKINKIKVLYYEDL
ncbi:unknown similar to AMEV104 [Adoxophyes honmai entomopoxvirus 'L']|uniref:Uncharacterized protein n=1 Tax=Adoxophyes honmai entomopoxvirus 'L' TaxID=1293540 RepID=A0A916KP08_9POXV|nr:unknown similar to AMEV104 [Adoxophyes honmai entomopoxvirus 'L']CCU55428.1 unknown similar to AMEV104 [Adoxophyes honmai entomopoxvirus 'L']